MEIGTGFYPDPDRARRLDQRMQMELASSLRHLDEAAEGAVDYDRSALLRLVDDIEGGTPYPATAFESYYRLAYALMEEDQKGAEREFSRLLRMEPRRSDFTIQPLNDPKTCPRSEVYVRCMTHDKSLDMGILPPSEKVFTDFQDRFLRGMDLLERAIPELAGEVRGIVHEVVCLVGDSKHGIQFDGGSHFQLWGALFLNAAFHETDASMVEVIAHESAHSLLFGFCTEEPLVYNDDDELFTSPLRRDPRPMDGIYHATYVSARMHWAMTRLLESGVLSPEDARATTEARIADARNFAAGYEVVKEHGRLSPVGDDLMRGAFEYMESTEK